MNNLISWHRCLLKFRSEVEFRLGEMTRGSVPLQCLVGGWDVDDDA